MNKQVFKLLLLSSTLLTLISYGVSSPSTFTSEAGGFSVWMPAELEQNNVVKTHTHFGQRIDFHTFFARANGAYWSVQYADYPKDTIAEHSTDEILDAARDQLLRDAFGQLQVEQKLSINGSAGRQIVAASALRAPVDGVYDGTYKARLLLVNNRLYLISTYVFNENWDNRLEHMDAFLESFKLQS